MGSINRQITRFEISAVYTHPEAKVDIVLVHGLNGHPEKTWTSKGSDEVFWPAELLPVTLKNKPANILVYGYNADVYTSVLSAKHNTATSSDFILTHAQSLANTLAIYRRSEETSKNPIIWVAHSLGGILVKRALLYSNDVTADKHDYLRSIYVSTYGIIFLGTPHQGSQVAGWARMLQAMAEVAVPKKLYHTEGPLLKMLKKDSEPLQHINNHFLDIYQRFKIQMVREAQMTDLKGTKAFIVDAASAGPDLPEVMYYSIEATHSSMCKFVSKDAPGYRNVSMSIRDWVKEAPHTIEVRWEMEIDDRRKRVMRDAAERVGRYLEGPPHGHMGQEILAGRPVATDAVPNTIEYQPPKLLPPSTGFNPDGDRDGIPRVQNPNDSFSSHIESEHGVGFPFIVPDGFRPNSFFKARANELETLHRVLMDPERRTKGTSSVLIHGMPGSGKTYLAREYVFRHLRDFPGGIFWVRAKSLKEAEDGFWRIARHEAFRSRHSQEDIRNLRDQSKMVEIVKKWLNKRQDWLMVVDGVHFADDEMHNFIPFTENTSLIFTSTERAIHDHRFNSPSLIELPRLRAREAQELLLEEIGKKTPYTQDDLSRAMELVQLVEHLPLMIHVAAQQMTATGEPLSKYLRSYRKSPKIGHLPAYRAVVRQLQDRGHTEALNLISILSFFGQEVPFELLTFGLRALDSATPVKTRDGLHGQASLNMTFKVLISFGLLERNADDAVTSPQGSASRSVESGSDGLDMVKLHSVVQAFFIDKLIEEKGKDIPFWLERAIAVYCRSYDDADRRIKANQDAGLPEDYRFYRTHGEVLMSHLDRFEKQYADRLSHAHGELESRYTTINSEIEELTETLLMGEGPVVSIFRSPSISDSDIATPVSAVDAEDAEYFTDDDDPAHVTSPISYEQAHENVPQFHRPYPDDDFYGGMPSMPREVTEDDGRTVTPGPGEGMSVFDDEGSEWTTVTHRTVRKNSSRRYRDHAGAWRQTTGRAIDPRASSNRPFTSISRYTARGIVLAANPEEFQKLGTQAHVKPTSEAEQTLAKINTISPRRSQVGINMQGKSRSSSSSALSRPSITTLERNSYARAAAGLDRRVGESAGPTFGRILEDPNKVTTALKKVEDIECSSKPSPGSDSKLTAEFGHPVVAGQDNKFADDDPLRATPVLAPQLVHSSPALLDSEWAVPGLTVERYSSSALHHGSASSPDVRSHDQTTPRPPHEWDAHQRTTHSMPAVPRTEIHPPASASHTGSNTPDYAIAEAALRSGDPPYPVHVHGYSSQPMSRNRSHQSTGSDPGNFADRRRGRSRPPPRFAKRASSIVESEPSPRLKPLIASPRYSSYHDGTSSGRWRPRADSESTARASPLNLQGPFSPSVVHSIFAGFKRKPSFIASSDDSGRSSHGSPDVGVAIGRTGRGWDGSESRSLSRGRVKQHNSTDTDMARSVSSGGGGFAVKGRIIEFGEHHVDIQEASLRLKADVERVNRANTMKSKRKNNKREGEGGRRDSFAVIGGEGMGEPVEAGRSPSGTRNGHGDGCGGGDGGGGSGVADSGVGLGIVREQ